MKTNKKVVVISIALILVAAAVGAGLWLLNDIPGQSDSTRGVQTISGTITRIDLDCEKARYLDENGKEVVSEEPAICDSGNSIEIDETRTIYTSSGFTDPEHAFDKHNEGWELGDDISLTVLENESGNYTLDCDTCGEN